MIDKYFRKLTQCTGGYRYWPFFVLATFALILSMILRIYSFSWNDRLQGDVNLFALTAREFVSHDRLFYPMKYEYSDLMEYQILQSPASQHPPLWPYLGGLLGKLFSTPDTFWTLKILCTAIGLLFLLSIIALNAERIEIMLVSFSIMALSPILIDFSANGSSYILSALTILLAVILLKRFDYHNIIHYISAGFLCSIGLQTHSIMIFLPLVFLLFALWEHSQITWQGVIALIFSGILMSTPWVLWNWHHFGRVFYSYSFYYLLDKLEMAHTGLYNDVITTYVTKALDWHVFSLYLTLVVEEGADFVKEYFLAIGPFCLFLAILGSIQLFNSRRREAIAILLPYLSYVAIVFLWATFKYRFLVPALPLAYIIAAHGFIALYNHKNSLYNFLGIICLTGTLGWGMIRFLEPIPTQYYRNDDTHALHYQHMLPIAHELRSMEPGTILGYSRSLDGGIETIYWHELPFVHGRGLEINEIQKLIHDFDIRYIWADQSTVNQIQPHISQTPPILANEFYFVFDLSQR